MKANQSIFESAKLAETGKTKRSVMFIKLIEARISVQTDYQTIERFCTCYKISHLKCYTEECA